jgi:2-polyprenyl-6-methoxyphenol hydroxylase-like FAD-dependent oxidoreductase
MGKISTACVIAGGGPAGMMLGFLLARAGMNVTVLEKHKHFRGEWLRQFPARFTGMGVRLEHVRLAKT